MLHADMRLLRVQGTLCLVHLRLRAGGVLPLRVLLHAVDGWDRATR
jgi:hypothetical protein